MSASALTAHFLDTEAVLVQLVHRLHVLEHPDEGAEPLAARLYDRRASKNSRRLASSGPASSLAAFFFSLSSSSGLPSAPFLRSGGVFSSSPEWCPERWGLDLSGFFSMEKEEKMKKMRAVKVKTRQVLSLMSLQVN